MLTYIKLAAVVWLVIGLFIATAAYITGGNKADTVGWRWRERAALYLLRGMFFTMAVLTWPMYMYRGSYHLRQARMARQQRNRRRIIA